MLSIGEVAMLFGVCIQTIRRWDKSGKLKSATRTMRNHRRYNQDIIKSIINNEPIQDKNITICYSRVSTQAQKDDLIRQTQVLKQYAIQNNYNNVKYIEDIGSGLNYNKKGLQELIYLLLSGEINTLIIQYKDRLLRFGSDIIFTICKQKGIKVVILENTLNKTKEEDFALDVLSILTVYTSKIYGSRSHKNINKLKKE